MCYEHLRYCNALQMHYMVKDVCGKSLARRDRREKTTMVAFTVE